MLYQEVASRIEEYESKQEVARTGLSNAARATVLHAADHGSKKSSLDLTEFPAWAEQISWLRKQWRGQGVHISVHGSFLHFNATGSRSRRSLHDHNDYDNIPEAKAW